MNILKVRIFNIENRKCANVRKLEMIPLAWKFNSKQLLSKTLNSRRNIIETRAVSNIFKKDGKYVLEDKREVQEIILKFIIFGKNEVFKYYFISGQNLNNLQEPHSEPEVGDRMKIHA